jgi:acetyl esterase/lipase
VATVALGRPIDGAGVDLGGLTLQERRAFMASAGLPPPAGTTVEPVDADGGPAEWVAAAGLAGDRVLQFFHGGGYHIGSLATLRRLLALLSDAAQARVLNVDYRLAPEHPFPAAFDDALADYRWLLASGAEARQITVAGSSSGGGLALDARGAARRLRADARRGRRHLTVDGHARSSADPDPRR